MGSELSCPCSSSAALENEEEPKEKIDIVEELMKGKLTIEEIFFQYVYAQSKVCLINTNQLEPFFNNRNLLKLSTKKEINYYYNLVFITNFIFSKDNFIFILLQYTPGMEDKSFRNSSCLSNSKNKYNKKNPNLDYKSYYKIEKVNLVSNEKKKVIEQILNDLNSNLKKDFLFYGIINDCQEILTTHTGNYNTLNSKNPNSVMSYFVPRSFQILYKRSLIKEMIDCKYTIETYEGQLDRDILNEILSNEANSNKILKAIMVDNYASNLSSNSLTADKFYYFIFEENLSIPQSYVYLVIELQQGTMSDKIFLQDITIKLNDYQNEYRLCCLVTDEINFYVIFAASEETLEMETPMDIENDI